MSTGPREYISSCEDPASLFSPPPRAIDLGETHARCTGAGGAPSTTRPQMFRLFSRKRSLPLRSSRRHRSRSMGQRGFVRTVHSRSRCHGYARRVISQGNPSEERFPPRYSSRKTQARLGSTRSPASLEFDVGSIAILESLLDRKHISHALPLFGEGTNVPR